MAKDDTGHDIMELCKLYHLLSDSHNSPKINEAKTHLADLIHEYITDLAFED
jgi:hypothetical protein